MWGIYVYVHINPVLVKSSFINPVYHIFFLRNSTSKVFNAQDKAIKQDILELGICRSALDLIAFLITVLTY